MLTLVALSLFFSAHAQAKPGLPKKPAPAQAAKDPIRALLDSPFYYLSYHMHFEGSASDATSDARTKRDVEGQLKLNVRTQGPSLSGATAMADPTKINSVVSNYASWMHGMTEEEMKSDASMQAAAMQMLYAYTGSIDFSLNSHYKQPISESDELEDVTVNVKKTGKGRVGMQIMPMLELNGIARKFKILLPYQFNDPETQPYSAHRHTRTIVSSSRGTTDTPEDRDESLWLEGPKVVSNPEPSLVLEGNLPTNGNALFTSQSFKANADGIDGTMTVTVMLYNTPPEQVELILDLPKDYASWRPKGSVKGETVEGNMIRVGAHFQKVGGGKPKTKHLLRMEYKLVETSAEKGVCMNWPAKPQDPPLKDLKIAPEHNPELLVEDNGQSAADTGLDNDKPDSEVWVSTYDWGGSADLEVTAVLDNGERVTGKVKGSGEVQVQLPKRPSRDSHVAVSFFDKNSLGDLPDDHDGENYPVGNGFKGDGLTLYEEYRGFVVGSRWTDGDPTKKELFVVNTMRDEPRTWKGITIYEKATGVKVHRYTARNEVDPDQVINFNRTDGAHVVDQHALFIVPGPLKQNFAQVVKVGPPKLALHVEIPPDFQSSLTAPSGVLDFFAMTVAHEMGHGSSMDHHGNSDNMVKIREDNGKWVQYNTVEKEDPNGATTLEYVFPPSGPVKLKIEKTDVEVPVKKGEIYTLWNCVEGGQHSGDNDCLMKYICGNVYQSQVESDTWYLVTDEYAGMTFCKSSDGTGVNDPNWAFPASHPHSRHGAASNGDCIHQLCINDLYTPP